MDLGRQLIAVVFVLGTLVLALWMLRKRGYISGIVRSGGSEKHLQLIERLPLTPSHSLHLIRAGTHTILVGVHGTGVTLICDFGEKP